MAKQIDWHLVKTDYFVENLHQDKGKPFTLKDLSVRWKIAYKTVRNRASEDGWNDELRDKIAEQQIKILQKVQQQEIETEADVRQRQAQVARYLVDKALLRLVTVAPEDLTKREAIELAKFALGEERKALSITEKGGISPVVEVTESQSVAEQMARLQAGDALFGKLLHYLEKTVPSKKDCN